MSNRLDRTAWIALILLIAAVAYIVFRMASGTGLSAAEKTTLFHALTFHNEELEKQLRSAQYFAGIPTAGNAPLDVSQTMELWRRACTDRSFDEVRRSLAVYYHQFAPARYYDAK
jgi:hypothetical protein